MKTFDQFLVEFDTGNFAPNQGGITTKRDVSQAITSMKKMISIGDIDDPRYKEVKSTSLKTLGLAWRKLSSLGLTQSDFPFIFACLESVSGGKKDVGNVSDYAANLRRQERQYSQQQNQQPQQ